jgi:DNA-directed RNA polymerase subunit H (RpoH/RPB5)
MNLEKQIRCSLGVVTDMMVARGHDIDRDKVERTLDDTLEAYTLSFTRHADTAPPSSNLLVMDIDCAVVMYALQHKQQRMADLRKRLDAVVSGMQPNHHVVIIVTHNMTEANINAMCKSINNMCVQRINSQTHKVLMQHFYMNELQYNITQHEMVPRHDLVPAQEVPAILQKYGLRSKHQLPLICKTDPMSKFLGLRPGDVVCIIRPSKQSVEYKVYRVCA